MGRFLVPEGRLERRLDRHDQLGAPQPREYSIEERTLLFVQASDKLAVCSTVSTMTSPERSLNWILVPCVAVEMTPPSACVEIEPRLCMARPYIAKILLEVDEGDARFWKDVEFLNVDLGTCESESEKKQERSVDWQRTVLSGNTRAVVGQSVAGRTPGVVRSKWREYNGHKDTWDKSNPDIDHARHGSCSSGGCEA